jgi:hypothetical protein
MFVFSPGRMFPGGAVDYCPTGAILLLLLLLLSISSLRAYELKNLLVKSFIIFPMASAKASLQSHDRHGADQWDGALLHGLFERD